jgi:hypothetical protein
MKSRTIYVLLASDGLYEDVQTRAVAAYESQEQADEVCRLAQAIINRAQQGSHPRFEWEPVASDYDPKAGLCDGVGTSYSVEAVELHLDRE